MFYMRIVFMRIVRIVCFICEQLSKKSCCHHELSDCDFDFGFDFDFDLDFHSAFGFYFGFGFDFDFDFDFNFHRAKDGSLLCRAGVGGVR